MKTLDEHNKERSEWHTRPFKYPPNRNGIECPKCQSELLDSDPGTLLMSYPPRVNVLCESCGYTGSRVS